MGTNYYAHVKGNPLLRWIVEPEKVHIGKSSGGWVFSLHVKQNVGDEFVSTWADWKRVLQKKNVDIYDEYDQLIDKRTFFAVVEKRSWNRPVPDTFDYERNHAVPGPNGLIRHKVDGRHCIGHGEGTWDYIIGEFS